VLLRRTDVGSCVAASLEFASCGGGPLVLGRAPRQVEGAEQLLAALVATGITDLVVELDTPELPYFDGSMGPYLDLVHEAGLQVGPDIVPALEVAFPVRVENGTGWLELRPAERLRLEVWGAWPGGSAGAPAVRFEVSARSTAAVASPARWSPTGRDARLFRQRRARQGSPFASESLRHGAVQLLGCLALAGRPLRAEVAALQPTPALAVAGLRALAAEAVVGL